MRYIDDFLRFKGADVMVRLGLFPNGKEITESGAAYSAVVKHLREVSLSSRNVTLVAVGDGHSPRTGALFALRSAWTCYSVDPALKPTGGRDKVCRPASRRWETIERLNVRAKRIEEITIDAADTDVIIVAVHSHATLSASVAAIRGGRSLSVVSIPCCVPQHLSKAPDVDYEDPGILSPQRRVLVWRNVNRQ
jgi:hypothetical protein